MSHPVFIMEIDTFDTIYKKDNTFQTIKASDTLKHQPMVWHMHSHITQAGTQWAPDPGTQFGQMESACMLREGLTSSMYINS